MDRLVGGLAHVLHVRGAKINTVDDLGPYLGTPLPILFPLPSAPRDMTRRHAAVELRGRTVERLEWRSEHTPLSPTYGVRHAGEYARNQTASARWVHPQGRRRRNALVYVHGWLEPAPWTAFFLARFYDALGVDVLDVELPFHGQRNPKSALFHGELFWTGDLVRSFEAIRQSCIDTRSLIAWLRAQGYARVGVMGVSLGASIAMALACVDPVPDSIVAIIGHLQLADVVEDAPIFWRMKADLERFGVDRSRRKRIFAQFGLDQARPLLPRERQLWIMARNDHYVSAPAVRKQWHDWGEPPIEWIEGGHTTFALSLPRIVARVRSFYEALARMDPPVKDRDRRDTAL